MTSSRREEESLAGICVTFSLPAGPLFVDVELKRAKEEPEIAAGVHGELA
jgi:hypothetical protein